MQPQRLENLSERLLVAGVAPRHVKRYMRELRDHYDDALREELAKGHSPQAAAQTAWMRLGDDEQLAQSVLSRPELRSLASRYPRIVFGAGPMIMWLGACILTIMTFAFLEQVLRAFDLLSPPGPDPAWLYAPIYGGTYFYVRVLPVLLGMWMIVSATRQRLPLTWPIIGATVIAIATGTMTFQVILSTTEGQKGELSIGSSLPFLTPFLDATSQMNGSALIEGLVRSAIMFALILAPVWLQRRRLRRISIA